MWSVIRLGAGWLNVASSFYSEATRNSSALMALRELERDGAGSLFPGKRLRLEEPLPEKDSRSLRRPTTTATNSTQRISAIDDQRRTGHITRGITREINRQWP